MGVEDDELEGQGADSERDNEEVKPRSLIAAPGISKEMPAVSLRGLPAPSPGSTADLESQNAAFHIAPRPVAKPSPLETRTAADEAEYNRKLSTGSGISQIHNPVARYALRGLETVGGILSPRATSMIPGTELHHNALLAQDQGRIGEDLGEAKEEATTGETQARTEQAEAAAAKDRAQTAEMGQPKPKEEKWDPYTGFTDVDGTPLMREENSRQVVRADNGKPPTQIKPATPELKTTKSVRIVNGVPHEILENELTGGDIKDLGQTKLPGESPVDKRSAQESAQVERESRQSIRKAEEAYRATQKSVNQLTASIDAAKDGNGLLTSFVPTMAVLGINVSNGVHRISPAEAQAAALPGGWAERFNAWFDKAAKGKLSPQLQQEGKELAGILRNSAYQQYKSTYEDESGMVEGYGGKDFGKRVKLIPAEEAAQNAGGTEPVPPREVKPGMKWQHRTTNGQIEWREVPQ